LSGSDFEMKGRLQHFKGDYADAGAGERASRWKISPRRNLGFGNKGYVCTNTVQSEKW
jgi:hypothetical protein